ncbi:MAG: UDP-2,3-diacylglucosamine diphosphatase [Xanthomonadales bacterium]|nr:UDP-2,3-diacylglucosamine diphosphatase [Xanthomonadales bacterium]
MATLFISDLHLEDKRPEITAILVNFLRGPARAAESLYILGDLFEFWIGDDVLSNTASTVATELKSLSDHGVAVYFQHGNRDFLLGENYAQLAGMTLLPESLTVDLYGKPTLLLHGDTLCTDDIEYQAFRQQVRNPAFQAMFLNQSVEQRLAMAASARDASKQHTGKADMAIMDVNAAAVVAAFEQVGGLHMIHGHTHRPAVHQHELNNGSVAERIVLADWYQSGSYLQVTSAGAIAKPLQA